MHLWKEFELSWCFPTEPSGTWPSWPFARNVHFTVMPWRILLWSNSDFQSHAPIVRKTCPLISTFSPLTTLCRGSSHMQGCLITQGPLYLFKFVINCFICDTLYKYTTLSVVHFTNCYVMNFVKLLSFFKLQLYEIKTLK